MPDEEEELSPSVESGDDGTHQASDGATRKIDQETGASFRLCSV